MNEGQKTKEIFVINAAPHMVQRQTKGETTMDTSSIPGLELIQVADVVAREKSIEREEVMLAMEEAIQKAGRAKYGLDRDIRAMIDRKTGSHSS